MDIIDIPASTSTYSSGRGGKPVEWIVIHYTGAAGTARNNGDYFAGGNRNASANYFLDGSEVVRSVGDGDTAWAVGNFDMNQRSVSIEVCSDGEDFTAAEVAQLTELTRSLMDAYGVDANHVIRHHDVADHVTTGSTVSPHKDCPAPYVSGDPDGSKWASLHDTITSGEASTPTITRLTEDTMECIINWNDEGKMVWFDGTKLHWLDEPDTMKAVQQVYALVAAAKKADPNNIPVFTVGEEGAPWASRFAEAVGDGSEELRKFLSDHK